jgi:hypothetical protein
LSEELGRARDMMADMKDKMQQMAFAIQVCASRRM